MIDMMSLPGDEAFNPEDESGLMKGEFLVICVDATGEKTDGGMDITAGYDEGQEFIANASSLGKDFIAVEDRTGKKCSCPRGQFKKV